MRTYLHKKITFLTLLNLIKIIKLFIIYIFIIRVFFIIKFFCIILSFYLDIYKCSLKMFTTFFLINIIIY
jgi:hypothetical protein